MIVFLMDLPNPLHGMSSVNQAILDKVNFEGKENYVINTAPSHAASLFGTRLWDVLKLVHSCICMFNLFFRLLMNPKLTVYRPINGGYGQAYDLFFIGICRLFRTNLFIHHHSFNYLNKFSFLFFFLNKIVGVNGVHVVLGLRMSELLSLKYKVKCEKIRTVSNVAFFGPNVSQERNDDTFINIGHLANLCGAKGLDVFIDVCRELKKKNVRFRAKIAGPFADDLAGKLVRSACGEMTEIEYLGALYRDEKNEFYRSLDAFVFPSRYKNEAEPLVLFEAAQSGSILFGTRRGCMETVIELLLGYSYLEGDDLANMLATDIQKSSLTGEFSNFSREKRLEAFDDMLSSSKNSVENLLYEMGANNVSEIR